MGNQPSIISESDPGKSSLLDVDVSDFLARQLLLLQSKQADHYIERTFTDLDELTQAHKLNAFLWSDKKTLLEIVQKDRLALILGGAGSGKSIELLRLGLQLQQMSASKRTPIYIRLNEYEGGPLESLLPAVWTKINKDQCQFIFDGLDEITETYRLKAIQTIIEFAAIHPTISIVVSCRTNFYQPFSGNQAARLAGFSVYEIDDLTIDHVKKYVDRAHNNGQRFIDNALRMNFGDLILKPFFLRVLLDDFKSAGCLTKPRSVVLQTYIESNISNDIHRYSIEDEQRTLRRDVVAILRRCALVMESMGKNYLSQAELDTIVKTPYNESLLRHFSMFRRASVNGHWRFEHNIIQEYLAAKNLERCSVEQIKVFLSTSEKKEHIKPFWMNTFSFLMSLIDEETKKELLDWVLSINPELLVKVERERIPEETRQLILEFIFEEFKKQNLWLHSRYFTEHELANFSESPSAFTFLLNELDNKNNSVQVKVNALSILKHFVTLTPQERVQLRDVLYGFIEEEINHEHTANYILSAFVYLGFTQSEIITNLLSKYRDRRNAYIRSGIYRIIEAGNYIDDEIDYILDGVTITTSQDFTDRNDTRLLDENTLLDRILPQIKGLESTTKLISYLTDNVVAVTQLHYDNIEPILKNLAANATSFFATNPMMYDHIGNLVKSLTRTSHVALCELFRPFFEQTGTLEKFVFDAWQSNSIKPYTKSVLIGTLANDNIFIRVTELYQQGRCSRAELEKFSEMLGYASWETGDLSKANRFLQMVTETIGETLEVPKRDDHTAELEARFQHDFDVLFNPKDFAREVKNVYAKLGRTSLTPYELNKLRDLEKPWDINVTPVPVIRFVRQHSDSQTALSEMEAEEVMQDLRHFSLFIMHEIYEQLKGRRTLHVTKEQQEFIEQWCRKQLPLFAIENNRLVYDKNKSGGNFEGINNLLWYFITRFNFFVPATQLLPFTVYHEIITVDGGGILTKIEELIGRTATLKAVLANIQSGIIYSNVLKTNYSYAIEKDLMAVLPYLKRDLINLKLDWDTRVHCYSTYVEHSGDKSLALQLIYNLEINDPFFNVLVPDAKSTNPSALEQLLEERLGYDMLTVEEKINTAIELVAYNNMSGINYLTEQVINNHEYELEYHTLKHFSKISNPAAIPNLMRLYELSFTDALVHDKYHTVQQQALNGLLNIGIQSTENMSAVKASLDAFMQSKGEKSEIYMLIRNIEFNLFDRNKTSLSLDKSLILIDAIAPLTESELLKLINKKQAEKRKKFRQRKVRIFKLAPLSILILLLFLGISYFIFGLNDWIEAKMLNKELPNYTKNIVGWVWLALVGFVTTVLSIRWFQPTQLSKFVDLIEYPQDMRDATEEDIMKM